MSGAGIMVVPREVGFTAYSTLRMNFQPHSAYRLFDNVVGVPKSETNIHEQGRLPGEPRDCPVVCIEKVIVQLSEESLLDRAELAIDTGRSRISFGLEAARLAGKCENAINMCGNDHFSVQFMRGSAEVPSSMDAFIRVILMGVGYADAEAQRLVATGTRGFALGRHPDKELETIVLVGSETAQPIGGEVRRMLDRMNITLAAIAEKLDIPNVETLADMLHLAGQLRAPKE